MNTDITKNVSWIRSGMLNTNTTLNGFVLIVKAKKEDLRKPERKDYYTVG